MTDQRRPAAVMIAGLLTEDEIAELMAAMRRIERRHPKDLYQLAVNYPGHEPDMGEMLAMLKRRFPRIPGDEPTFVVRKR